MTRYIRKAPQKTCSVPAENERKAGTVPFHMTPAHKSLLLWIPFSCALSYGSVSFMLLNPDITVWGRIFWAMFCFVFHVLVDFMTLFLGR